MITKEEWESSTSAPYPGGEIPLTEEAKDYDPYDRVAPPDQQRHEVTKDELHAQWKAKYEQAMDLWNSDNCRNNDLIDALNSEAKALLGEANQLRCQVATLEANNKDLKCLSILLAVALLASIVSRFL